MSPDALRADRYRKFRHMGAFVESGEKDAAPAGGE
jgi:hypothetical protein